MNDLLKALSDAVDRARAERRQQQSEPGPGHQASCSLCPWVSRFWPSYDEAGCNATWHVFENHPDHWRALFGDRPPTDPDPRKAS